ncbi:hypothetical protein [Thermomonas sp.]|uniref:hypothetical protein n=1 Tax=Thermomonas sp. TaxID=1971895 RepID=UPI00391B3366
MKRTIEQWRGCEPEAMATRQSDAARTFAFADAKADILELHRDNERLRELLADLKAWDVEQYMTIPHALRERIQRELMPNSGVNPRREAVSR